MRKHIIKFIESWKKKQFKTEDVEVFLIKKMKADYSELGGYLEFATIMKTLEEEAVIQPVRSKGENGLSIPLANSYRVLEKKKTLTEEQKKNLLLSYHPKMSMTPYLTDYVLYEKDRKYLDAINAFLYRKETEEISVNERSFELFRDEKWLSSEDGRSVLKRLGIHMNDFDCYYTYEPFFYYKARGRKEKESVNLLIIENKDTFFTLKSLFLKGQNRFNGVDIDLLVYGEGKKILKSIYFINEIESIEDKEWNAYYFGDIDPEGLYIYTALKALEVLPVKPMTSFYRVLVDTYKNEPVIVRKKEQERVKGNYQTFLEDIGEELSRDINAIVDNKGYLPQEGITRTMFKEMAN